MSLLPVEAMVKGESICITCVFRKDCNLSNMLFILERDFWRDVKSIKSEKNAHKQEISAIIKLFSICIC